jgi:hypothetical protein
MIKDVLKGAITSIKSILSIRELPNAGVVPQPLVTMSQFRSGMSALRAANKVLEKKKELGIPTGNLTDGSANDDDILWFTAIKAILHEISIESRITSNMLPGTQVVAAGANVGGPVVVYGSTVTFAQGGTIIE